MSLLGKFMVIRVPVTEELITMTCTLLKCKPENLQEALQKDFELRAKPGYGPSATLTFEEGGAK